MISRRVLEVWTAILTGSFGAAVAVSSFDNGIGWSTSGVDAGTFPFLTGVIIVIGSLYNLTRGLLPPRRLAGVPTAITRSELHRLAGLFVPAALFIAAIPLLGIYLASGTYVFAALALLNRQSVPRSLAMALVTPFALYIVFERIFQVTLPHGAFGL